MPYTTPSTITTGQLVTATLMNNEWAGNISFLANPPTCRVYNNAAISIPNVTTTPLTFNSERFDTDSMHSMVSNTGRITFNTAGVYVVTANISWAASAVGFRITNIRLNGATVLASTSSVVRSDGFLDVPCPTIYKFAVGDYIEVTVFQNSGAALNVSAGGGSFTPEFAAAWVGNG